MSYPWSYRCSLCASLIDPDDVSAHVDAHRAEANRPGTLSLSRVDHPADTAPRTPPPAAG
jgi:hypothetical protein